MIEHFGIFFLLSQNFYAVLVENLHTSIIYLFCFSLVFVNIVVVGKVNGKLIFSIFRFWFLFLIFYLIFLHLKFFCYTLNYFGFFYNKLSSNLYMPGKHLLANLDNIFKIETEMVDYNPFNCFFFILFLLRERQSFLFIKLEDC